MSKNKALGIFYAFCFTIGVFAVPTVVVILIATLFKYFGGLGLVVAGISIIFCVFWHGIYEEHFSE